MELQRTTIDTLSNELLFSIFTEFFKPEEAVKLSRVCKRWKEILQYKPLLEKIANTAAQNLQVPIRSIAPETQDETYDIQEYKACIQNNTVRIQQEIRDIILKVFPSIEMQKNTSIQNPTFFTPYAEHIKTNAQDPHQWNIFPNSSDILFTELKTFLNSERLYPKIFMLFIENLSFEALCLNSFDHGLTEIINNDKIQQLSDWIETARQCKNIFSSCNGINPYELFFHLTCTKAVTYVLHYSEDTLQQIEHVKSDLVFACFVEFLDKVLDNAFIEKIKAEETILNPLGNQNSKRDKENCIDSIKLIITQYKLQNL